MTKIGVLHITNIFTGDTKMKKRMQLIVAGFVVMAASQVWANSAPVVSSVSASQRGDSSKLVDIYYDLADADGDSCTVWVAISDDGGANWRVPADNFSGAVGQSITPETNKHVTWDAGLDMPGKAGNFKVRVWADDGNGPDSMAVIPGGWFAYQNAAPGSYKFVDSFSIAKYETTVSQYCQFLNAADPDGTYWASGQEIIKKGDPGNYYYEIQAGRNNYPVRYVSIYDAEAYAAWKSSVTGFTYRLPTEQEWEKAAGWDPVLEKLWTYAFQSGSIDCSKCNYNYCVGAPTIVGSYDPHKSYYGCYDMSGNLWEWTSSIYSGDSRVLRGGCWSSTATVCLVTYRNYYSPSNRNNYFGFRLALDLD